MKGRLPTIVASCAGPNKNIPVPDGYSVDWSGWLEICGDPHCPSFTFENGERHMEVRSSSFLKGTPYYLFVYTLRGKQLIESYPAGEVDGRAALQFATPFENGFAYPSQDWVGFEIVHAS